MNYTHLESARLATNKLDKDATDKQETLDQKTQLIDYRREVADEIKSRDPRNFDNPAEVFDPIKVENYESLTLESSMIWGGGQKKLEVGYSLLTSAQQEEYKELYDNPENQKKLTLEMEPLVTAINQALEAEHIKRVAVLDSFVTMGVFEKIDGIYFVKKADNIKIKAQSDSYVEIARVLENGKSINRCLKITEDENRILPPQVELAQEKELIEERAQTLLRSGGEYASIDEDMGYNNAINASEYDTANRLQIRSKAELNQKTAEAKEGSETYYPTREEVASVYGEVLAYNETGWVCEDTSNRSNDLMDASNTLIWYTKDTNEVRRSSVQAMIDSSEAWQKHSDTKAELIKQINDQNT